MRIKGISIQFFNLFLLIILSIQLSGQVVTDSTSIDSLTAITILPDSSLIKIKQVNISLPDSIVKADSIKTDDSGFLEYKVEYNATDSMLFDLSKNQVHLYGESYVKYGDITLTSDNIVYDFDTYSVEARGGVDSLDKPKDMPIFKQGREEFKATEISYNFKSEKGFIKEVYSKMDEAFVYAKQSKKQPNNHVHIKGGFFTTCDKPNPHYSFRTTKMIVIPDDKVITGPGYLSVGKVPLPVALPFAIFPNRTDQASGIIIPKYGDSRQQGFFFRDGGYYWAINDYIHTEFLGTIFTNSSWGIKNKTAYVKRYKFRGNFVLSYQDFVFGDRDIEGNSSESKSFTANWSHRQDNKASKNSSFNANVNFVAGSGYRNDIAANQEDYINRSFNSNIAYALKIPNTPFSLTANAKMSQKVTIDGEGDSQTNRTTNDLTLPQITFNMQRITIPMAWIRKNKVGSPKWYEKIGITYTMNAQNRIKYTPSQLDTIKLTRNNYRQFIDIKNGIDQRANLSTSFSIKTLTFTPFVNGRLVTYSSQIEKFLDPENLETVTDTLYGLTSVGGINSGMALTTKLYGMYSFKRNGRIQAMRHQVTLTVNGSYTPALSNTRVYGYFGDEGTFSFYDRYQGAIYSAPSSQAQNTYNFTLINDLEAKVKNKSDSTTTKQTYRKVKFIDNLRASTSYDALRDSIKWRDVNINGRFTKLFNVLTINYNAILDPYAYNTSGQKIKSSYFKQTGKPIRLRSAGFVAQFRIKSKKKAKKIKPKNQSEQQILDMIEEKEKEDPGSFFNFNVPWTVSINYNLRLTNTPLVLENGKLFNETNFTSNTVSVVGSFTLFKMFSFSVGSGYDIKNKDVLPSRLNLTVDLHCWELALNYRTGRQQSYSISFYVKSSLLRDLKIEKKDTFQGGSFF